MIFFSHCAKYISISLSIFSYHWFLLEGPHKGYHCYEPSTLPSNLQLLQAAIQSEPQPFPVGERGRVVRTGGRGRGSGEEDFLQGLSLNKTQW